MNTTKEALQVMKQVVPDTKMSMPIRVDVAKVLFTVVWRRCLGTESQVTEIEERIKTRLNDTNVAFIETVVREWHINLDVDINRLSRDTAETICTIFARDSADAKTAAPVETISKNLAENPFVLGLFYLDVALGGLLYASKGIN